MTDTQNRTVLTAGFTLVEMIIVVAIIGILASIAVPLLKRHQLVSKSSEVRTNLSAIRVVEESIFGETGAYVAAAAEPAVIPGATKSDFDATGSDFADIGWQPEGRVYFSYAIAISADQAGYTIDAGADIDADGVVQLWGYTKADPSGAFVTGAIGCNPAVLVPTVVSSCNVGSSVF